MSIALAGLPGFVTKSHTPAYPRVYLLMLIHWGTKMTRNVGTVDRVIRIVVGLAILSLVFVGPQTMWGLLGLVPLLTAVVGWCPPYAILGINTCSRSSQA